MNSSNFSLARCSQSVEAQSATRVFLKHPSIFVTLLSSVTMYLLMKNALQCVSKSRTTLGEISPSIKMGGMGQTRVMDCGPFRVNHGMCFTLLGS